MPESGVSSVGIILGLDEVQHGHPRLELVPRAFLLEEFALANR